MLEMLKAFLFGVVEGITEWLPVSSTGHMIVLDQYINLSLSEHFKEMFLVVIQFGAILAVVVLYWNEIWPFTTMEKGMIKKEKLSLWYKIIVACIPAAIAEILFGDTMEEKFYNYIVVSIMLILVGFVFLIVEEWNKNKKATVTEISQITYKNAFIIGIFQLIAAIFPGTSRSGATIVGALILGLARNVAAEFTFYLAIPVMFGASIIKMRDFGLYFTNLEVEVLAIGMISSFIVSLFVIKFLMKYVKRHNFKVFGWYRILLGLFLIIAFYL